MGELPFHAGPKEDFGASTATWYRFQYCCAASRLLAAIAEGKVCSILCEWHEDYLFLMDGSVEAVSVKQRDQTQPQWSASTLVSDGNLRHLFESFEGADGEVHCRLETNRAHSVGDLWSGNAAVRQSACDDLAGRLGIDSQRTAAFANRFSIDASVPSAEHIASSYASDFAAPALDRLGLRYDPSEAMRVAGDLIANASRSQISKEARRAVLTASPDDRDSVLADKKLEDRRVTSERLEEVLSEAARDVVPRLLPQPNDVEVPPETTLTKKLRRGGLGPSVLESAGRRRALWFTHRARYRDIDYREQELDSLQEWVQDQANLSEGETAGSGEYGKDMLDRLTRKLRDPTLLPAGTRREDSDPALLSGAAFELTDNCRIWWSDPFPIQDDADA